MFTLQINTLAPKKVEKKIRKARVLSDNCRIFRNLKRYHQVLQKQKEKKNPFLGIHTSRNTIIKDPKNQEPIFTMSQGLSLQRQEDNRSTVIIRSRRSLNTRILRIKPNNTTETERSQSEDTTLTTQDAKENFVMPSRGRMETKQIKSLRSGNKKESSNL